MERGRTAASTLVDEARVKPERADAGSRRGAEDARGRVDYTVSAFTGRQGGLYGALARLLGFRYDERVL